MDPCVLCSRADHLMTREHVFAHWLVIKLRAGRLVPSGVSPGTERIGRVIATVCADCNAGWMSSLESSFRRVVFGAPRVGVLHEPDRVTLSRWFAKTAILLAHAHGAALVGAAQRAQLAVGGMPDDIEVFVARWRRPPQRLDFAVEADAVSILVDDLVGHVAPRGVLTSHHGTRLWPLRSYVLRWETLPVTRPLQARGLPARRNAR